MRTLVKLGGSILSDSTLRQKIISDIVKLKQAGHELILTHGGGKQINSLLNRLNIESKFHDGLRITDAETRDVLQMVLSGQVGKQLIAELAKVGIEAVSLTGGDGLSFLAERMDTEDGTNIGFVGKVVNGRATLIFTLLQNNLVPVYACVALGRDDFEYYNINGDQMASAVAATVEADNLVFVTDVGSVLDENENRIPRLNKDALEHLLDSGIAYGGMRPKLRACLQALNSGVKRILIIGASENNSLIDAVVNEKSVGTKIVES